MTNCTIFDPKHVSHNFSQITKYMTLILAYIAVYLEQTNGNADDNWSQVLVKVNEYPEYKHYQNRPMILPLYEELVPMTNTASVDCQL